MHLLLQLKLRATTVVQVAAPLEALIPQPCRTMVRLKKLKSTRPLTYLQLGASSVSRASSRLRRTDSTRKLKTTSSLTRWAFTCKMRSRSFWREEMKSRLTFWTSTSTRRWEVSTSYSESMHLCLQLSSTGSHSCSRWRKSSTRPRTTRSSPPWITTRWSASYAPTSRETWSSRRWRPCPRQPTSLLKPRSPQGQATSCCSNSMKSKSSRAQFASTSISTNSWRMPELCSKKAQRSLPSTFMNSAASSLSITPLITLFRDSSHPVSPFPRLKQSLRFWSPRLRLKLKNKSRNNHSVSSLIW